MLECLNCQTNNPIFAQFCANCGNLLKGPRVWAMAGCDAARSGHQDLCGQSFFDMGFVKSSDAGKVAGYNLPQPVLAHDSFWFWNLSDNKLCGIRLEKNRKDYPDSPNYSLAVAGADSLPGGLHFGHSLVFDGLFLWFVLGDGLWRLKVATGPDEQGASSRLEIVFKDNALNPCRAAPLIVRPDSQKPQRYLTACLKTHLLVADVSRKDSFNCRLLRWQEDGGNDEMHSAVAVGARVFCLSRQGKFFLLNLSDGLGSLPADGEQISPFTLLFGHFCAAPLAVGDYLVFETLKKERLRPDSDVHLKGIAGLDSRTFFLSGPVPLSQIGQRPERSGDFFGRDHLPGLTDGNFCYFCGDEKTPAIYFEPASQTLSAWTRAKGRLENSMAMDSTNAVLSGKRMVLVGQGIVTGWNLSDGQELFTRGIHQGGSMTFGNRRLLARPLVYGNLLALVFPNMIVFEKLP